MTGTAAKTRIVTARLVIGLVIAFAVIGVIWHGVSGEVWQRLWRDLLDRPGGPMTFRFILQPVMAAIAAWRDGVQDARAGRAPFLWTVMTQPADRGRRLHEGLTATARIILLGLGMDVVYQAVVLKAFYPGEAVIVAALLAFVPYLLLRGPVARIARKWGSGLSTMKH